MKLTKDQKNIILLLLAGREVEKHILNKQLKEVDNNFIKRLEEIIE